MEYKTSKCWSRIGLVGVTMLSVLTGFISNQIQAWQVLIKFMTAYLD